MRWDPDGEDGEDENLNFDANNGEDGDDEDFGEDFDDDEDNTEIWSGITRGRFDSREWETSAWPVCSDDGVDAEILVVELMCWWSLSSSSEAASEPGATAAKSGGEQTDAK